MPPVRLTPEQQRLVESNYWLAMYLLPRLRARSKWTQRLSGADALSVARYALVEAARKYDPVRGKFGTLLEHVLRTELSHAARHAGSISLPPPKRDGWREGVAEAAHRATQVRRLNPLDDQALSTLPEEPDLDGPAPSFEELLDNVPEEREREVLRLRFRDNLSLGEVGERLGISKQRVRQLEARSIDQIREQIDEDGSPRRATTGSPAGPGRRAKA